MKREDAVMTYAEAAEFVGVPVGTLYAWVNQRKIPHFRLGPRLVRFHRADVRAWLEQRRVHPEKATTPGGVYNV